jgi:hypothetical protein
LALISEKNFWKIPNLSVLSARRFLPWKCHNRSGNIENAGRYVISAQGVQSGLSGDAVKLIFVCPNSNKMFESANYAIIENKGVITDASGSRVLDATVALDECCPHCGHKHIYHAGELSCPFSGSKGVFS